jgi:hypothetical protein
MSISPSAGWIFAPPGLIRYGLSKTSPFDFIFINYYVDFQYSMNYSLNVSSGGGIKWDKMDRLPNRTCRGVKGKIGGDFPLDTEDSLDIE